MLDPVLMWMLRLVLAAIFMASGLLKLRQLEQFEASLAAYALVPQGLLKGVRVGVPGLELLASLLLLSPFYPLGNALIAALILIFSLAIAINLLRHNADIDCGCFGSLEQRLSWWLILRNAILLSFTLALFLPIGLRDLNWFDVLNLIFATLALLGLYITLNILISHAPKWRYTA
ncbi:MAG: MauE/DoxX family redox-associated membrane protein [Deinococcales bacterium]